MEASMTEMFIIIETEDGPINVVPDYSTMTIDELMDYAAIGVEEALNEIIKREPRTGQDIDPNAPVTIPES